MSHTCAEVGWPCATIGSFFLPRGTWRLHGCRSLASTCTSWAITLALKQSIDWSIYRFWSHKKMYPNLCRVFVTKNQMLVLIIPWDLTVKAAPEADHLLPVGQGDNGWIGPRPGVPTEAVEQGPPEEPCRVQWRAKHRRQTCTIQTDGLNQETWEILKNLRIHFPSQYLFPKWSSKSLYLVPTGREGSSWGRDLTLLWKFQSYRYSKEASASWSTCKYTFKTFPCSSMVGPTYKRFEYS